MHIMVTVKQLVYNTHKPNEFRFDENGNFFSLQKSNNTNPCLAKYAIAVHLNTNLIEQIFQFQFQFGRSNTYNDYEDVLKSKDLVVICTP